MKPSTWRAPWIERIAPGIFLFILPFTHTTPLRLVCLALSLAALVISILVNRKRRAALVWPPLFVLIAIAFWLLVCLSACLRSIEPSYSWGEFRNEVAYPLVAFSVFYWLTDSADAWRTWRSILFASFCAISVVAITSYLQNRDWLRSSFVGDRNAYSTYVVVIFPFLLLMLLIGMRGARRRWNLVAVIAALVLALVSGGLTVNRNLWLALAAESVAFGALFLMRSRAALAPSAFRRQLLAVVAGILILCGSFALVSRERLALLQNDPKQAQLSYLKDPRLEIWAYAGQYIHQRPLTGYGYGRGILRKEFRTHFNSPLKWHGHNMVVDYALEAGVPGAVAIIALFAAFYFQSARLYRFKGRHEQLTWELGMCGLALLAGITLKIMTDDILVREVSLLFWSLFGMMWGLTSRRVSEAVTSGARTAEGIEAVTADG